MNYHGKLIRNGTVVIRTSSPKPLLGVRFSHPLPFGIISGKAAIFF